MGELLGANTGCLPTTPVARTSSTFPIPSVMTQRRLMSCTVSCPPFVTLTV